MQKQNLHNFKNVTNVALYRHLEKWTCGNRSPNSKHNICTFTNGRNLARTIGYDKLNNYHCNGLHIVLDSRVKD